MATPPIYLIYLSWRHLSSGNHYCLHRTFSWLLLYIFTSKPRTRTTPVDAFDLDISQLTQTIIYLSISLFTPARDVRPSGSSRPRRPLTPRGLSPNRVQEKENQCTYILRSVDLWIKGSVKSRAFLLRRDASSPPPSERRATIHLPINIHGSVCQ